MKLYANITQEVYVNPIDVIDKLITNEIGDGYHLSNENNEYFICHERSVNVKISKEVFDYVNALYYIKNHIKEHISSFY